MKASELRIGNSIMQDEDFVFVTYWRLKLIEDGVLIYKPIPLTEELLIKFGLKFSIDTWYLTGFAIWETECGDAKGNEYMGFFYELREVGMMDRQIKYVHELQNLYFALTGEELTIKEL